MPAGVIYRFTENPPFGICLFFGEGLDQATDELEQLLKRLFFCPAVHLPDAALQLLHPFAGSTAANPNTYQIGAILHALFAETAGKGGALSQGNGAGSHGEELIRILVAELLQLLAADSR